MNRLRAGLAALEFAGGPNSPRRSQLTSLNTVRLCPDCRILDLISPEANRDTAYAHIPLQGSVRETACYCPAMILGVIKPM